MQIYVETQILSAVFYHLARRLGEYFHGSDSLRKAVARGAHLHEKRPLRILLVEGRASEIQGAHYASVYAERRSLQLKGKA